MGLPVTYIFRILFAKPGCFCYLNSVIMPICKTNDNDEDGNAPVDNDDVLIIMMTIGRLRCSQIFKLLELSWWNKVL